jgi:photosystem II stability/assembly factor-like uncharacterized protein
MKSRTLVIVLLTALIVPFCARIGGLFDAQAKPQAPADGKAGPEATFRDVLETPAAKDRQAAQSLLIAVVRAGTRLVGVGPYGHIVYSDDRGKSWTQASVPVSCDLLAVHFPTPRMGWAVGHDGVVLHSSDSGATWTKQFDGRAAAQAMQTAYGGSAGTADILTEVQKFVDQGPDKPFLDVWFESETTGFVVGAFNLIFRTVDGGKSWTPWYDRIDNPKHFHLYAIRPVGTDLFLTSEQGTVFRLDQKAQRFKEIKTPYSGTFFGITGKPGAIVAFGMRGNAFRSRDNGSRWEKVETGGHGGLLGATVTEDGKIVLVSQGGQVLVSSDNAASFTPVKVDQPSPAAAVAAIDNSTLALVGVRGVKVQEIK